MIYEFTIQLTEKQADRLMDQLYELEITNIYYESPIEITKVDNGFGYQVPEARTGPFRIYVESKEESLQRMEQISGIHRTMFEIRSIEDDEHWQQPFPEIQLEDGWCIRHLLSKSLTEQEDRLDQFIIQSPKTIILDSSSFGTGLHVTTQKLLNLILANDFHNQTVLDLGTGSGILSIAAGLRRAKQIIALDIQPIAEEVNHHARLNRLQQIQFMQADVLKDDLSDYPLFDHIFMNIGGDETIFLRPALVKHLKPNGLFYVSGMVEWNYRRVFQALHEIGFSLQHSEHEADWVTAVFCYQKQE
jgi:ribosomal protein L11 methyltransferase